MKLHLIQPLISRKVSWTLLAFKRVYYDFNVKRELSLPQSAIWDNLQWNWVIPASIGVLKYEHKGKGVNKDAKV